MKTCIDCKIEKNIEEFPWRNKTKNMRVGRCNVCHNKWYREYFSKPDNRKKQIKRVNHINKKQIEEARRYVFNFLIKNPCIDCGEKNPIVLEFDHKNSADKSFIISSALCSKSYITVELVKNEIDKCNVRCANCHRIKTAKESKFWKLKMLENKN